MKTAEQSYHQAYTNTKLDVPPVPSDQDMSQSCLDYALEDPQFLFKVVMVGDPDVGKTSLVRRYVVNDFRPHEKPTIGGTFLSKNLEIKKKRMKLQIWDTSGQDKFRVLQSIYFKGAVGAFLVFDLSSRESWQRLKTVWYDEVMNEGDEGMICMILGNKSDLPHENRMNSLVKSVRQSVTLDSSYYLTSAQDNTNVEPAYNAMGRVLFENFSKRPHCERVRLNSFKLSPDQVKKRSAEFLNGKKTCCGK